MAHGHVDMGCVYRLRPYLSIWDTRRITACLRMLDKRGSNSITISFWQLVGGLLAGLRPMDLAHTPMTHGCALMSADYHLKLYSSSWIHLVVMLKRIHIHIFDTEICLFWRFMRGFRASLSSKVLGHTYKIHGCVGIGVGYCLWLYSGVGDICRGHSMHKKVHIYLLVVWDWNERCHHVTCITYLIG